MTDPALLDRLDLLIGIVAAWLLLVLVVASFAIMLVDLGIGLLSLATVVLTGTVAGWSYLRGPDTTA